MSISQILLERLQIWGKRADQNLGTFLPPGPPWWNLIKIFSLFIHKLIGPGPLLQVLSMEGRPSTHGASNFGKTGQSNIWSIFASRSAVVEFDQNF